MKYLSHAGRVMAVALLTFQAPAFAADAASQQHVRGTLTAVSATALTVATATGSVVVVPVGAKTGVLGVVPATASEITPGTFIGTANVAGPAAARALEVVVFPKALAGTGEGDYPWDLPAGGKHSMMTNGTVGNSGGHSMMTNGTVGAFGGHSMMTNATVSHVTGSGVKTVNLTYKGGTKTVTIPVDAPIVRIVPGTKALLATGAHVVVFAGPGNAPAKAVIVGEKGVVPPM